jgi:predicted transcriptional regulator of viral defense system
VNIEDRVLRDLHRVAINEGRPGIAVPSSDLVEIAAAVGGLDAATQALKRLAQSRRVIRVRRDLVVLPDAAGLLGVEFVRLLDVVSPRPYLITAGAALQHAGLTDQHYFTFPVLVSRETSELRYRGSTARFFVVDPSNLWGWHGAASLKTRRVRHGVSPFASPERAIIDAINHPRYGMSLTQVSNALLRAVEHDRSFLRELHGAVSLYSAGSLAHGARAAARRTGYMVEQLFGAKAARPYRDLVGENRALALLRPGASRRGAVSHEWRLLVNARVEPEHAE